MVGTFCSIFMGCLRTCKNWRKAMPMKSTLEFQYLVFCIMRDFKCVSALLHETNERCSYPSTEQYENFCSVDSYSYIKPK